jgi:hypothetical protein
VDRFHRLPQHRRRGAGKLTAPTPTPLWRGSTQASPKSSNRPTWGEARTDWADALAIHPLTGDVYVGGAPLPPTSQTPLVGRRRVTAATTATPATPLWRGSTQASPKSSNRPTWGEAGTIGPRPSPSILSTGDVYVAGGDHFHRLPKHHWWGAGESRRRLPRRPQRLCGAAQLKPHPNPPVDLPWGKRGRLGRGPRHPSSNWRRVRGGVDHLPPTSPTPAGGAQAGFGAASVTPSWRGSTQASPKSSNPPTWGEAMTIGPGPSPSIL